MKTLPLAVPHMSESEAEEVFGWILDGEASEEEIARFLLANFLEICGIAARVPA